MSTMKRAAALAVAVGMLCACAKKVAEEPSSAAGTDVAGMTATPGAYLAYEHEVELEAAPDTIGPRVTAVRDACTSERFGACSVLAIEATNGEFGRSYITVRAVPAAIEPLVALASNGTTPKRRTTKAEDLADAVADVAQRRDLATRQRARLVELSERRDLGVGDLITVSQQIAALDSELHGLAQRDAEQRRRIETNRLTLWLTSNVELAEQGAFAGLWEMFVESLVEGVEGTAEYIGYFLPLLLVVFPLALLWRFAWRRATGAHAR